MSYYEQYKKFIDEQSENFDPDRVHVPIMSKQKWDTIEEVHKSIIRKKVRLDISDGINDLNFKISPKIIIEMDKSNRERTKAKKEQEKPAFLITINPKEDINLNELVSEIQTLTKSVWFAEGYITFEQRGENENELGRGLHVHILMVKYNIEFARLQKTLNRKFGKFVDVSKIKETLNIANKPRAELARVIDEYIFANGKQEEKHTKIEMDKLFRKKNGIKPYYHFECELGEKIGITTDEMPIFKKADGRTRNGGKRKGAGAPKGNCNRWKNHIPDLPSCENEITFEYQKKELHF